MAMPNQANSWLAKPGCAKARPTYSRDFCDKAKELQESIADWASSRIMGEEIGLGRDYIYMLPLKTSITSIYRCVYEHV